MNNQIHYKYLNIENKTYAMLEQGDYEPTV